MDEPDPAVIRAAAGGDTAAFARLVDATQADVWRFVRHLVGDADLAADVTQDTFVRVHQRLDTFRFESRFSSWLLRIARNRAIDELRARQRRDRLHERLRPGTTGSGSTAFDRVELQEALDALAPDLREAFVTVEVFGLPYRRAGEVLDVAEGTVKSRVHRARRELIAWFADEGTDSGHDQGTSGGD